MVGRIFLGRYEVIRLLGEGGMGRVYLARQTDLGRQVVVKVMHEHVASDPKFIERFQRETLLMARFQHPYAVTLYDASLNDPQGPCIVMEYIKGVSLDALLQRNGRFTPTRVGRLLGQLCEVLYAAHGLGIMHRDLKPANLMVVDYDTPYEKIKVMDFGLAKMIDAGSLKKANNVTGTDFAVGTPGYISPEQIRGDESDHRADLYSVGVVLFELLTGNLPFKGRSTMEVLLAHATEAPPSFAEAGAGAWVPPAVEEVVRRCLAKEPGERPASARDLAEEYETALAHEETVLETALPPNHPRSLERAAAATPPKVVDPNVVVNELEAWMPETIAAYKLRGFVHDKGGEVLESQPGLIRVRLGGPGSPYAASSGAFSWLGLGGKAGPIEMELRMVRTGDRDSLLHVTILMRDEKRKGAIDPFTRERCMQIFCDLRGYLMASASAKA